MFPVSALFVKIPVPQFESRIVNYQNQTTRMGNVPSDANISTPRFVSHRSFNFVFCQHRKVLVTRVKWQLSFFLGIVLTDGPFGQFRPLAALSLRNRSLSA